MSPVAYMRGMDNPFRPDPQLITSPDDPRIADYLSVRERDLTGRDGNDPRSITTSYEDLGA